MPKNIRIVSDGTPQGTKVFDENGVQMDIRRLTKIEWEAQAGHICKAVLTYTYIDVDVDLVAAVAE